MSARPLTHLSHTSFIPPSHPPLPSNMFTLEYPPSPPLPSPPPQTHTHRDSHSQPLTLPNVFSLRQTCSLGLGDDESGES